MGTTAMSRIYPTDYIKERVAQGCPKCGAAPTVTRNGMGDAVLVCDCGWRDAPIDCGFFGGMADARYSQLMAMAEQEGDPERKHDLERMAIMYSGLRRAVY